MANAISDQTTVLSNLSLTGNLLFDSTLNVSGASSSRVTGATGWFTSQLTTPNVSAISVNVQGGASLSGLTADFRTNLVVLSLDTRANASGMTTGHLRLVFQASGISLMYSSGKTQYTVAESATSLAQS